MLMKLQTLSGSIDLNEMPDLKGEGLLILSYIMLFIGIVVLLVAIIVSFVEGYFYLGGTLSGLALMVLACVVGVILVPSNQDVVDQRNSEISQILKNKYDVELVDPLYASKYELVPEHLTKERHRIINAEGIEQLVTFKLSEDNDDLILTREAGEIPTAKSYKGKTVVKKEIDTEKSEPTDSPYSKINSNQ